MKNKNTIITVRKPTWLDRITRLDGSVILAGEVTNGVEPLPQNRYYIRSKKNYNGK